MRASKRELIYERDGGLCVRCGQLVERASFHLDHYPIPRALGGPSTSDNLRVAHRRCNIAAGRQVVAERRGRGLKRADGRNDYRLRLRDDDLALIVDALHEALPMLGGARRERVLRLLARLRNSAPGNPYWRLNQADGFAAESV